MTNKLNVLITGGTGTLGAALVQTAVSEERPWNITVFSRDHIKQAAMKRMFPQVHYVLGDVADYDSVYKTAVAQDLIIHAAAQKHIPAAEENILDTVRINVHGSHNVAMAAIMAGVKRVIAVSTDKVCDPSSIYGMTKAMMERLLIQYANEYEGICDFAQVRYGNVLGSAGSVLQVWRRQAIDGGPLTITDPEMTRFWLSKADAVQLVMNALRTPTGTVLIPLAPGCSMAQLANMLYPEMDKVVTGKRPGEKDHELLLTADEIGRCEEMGDQLLLTQYPVYTLTSAFGVTGYRSDKPLETLKASDLWGML